jgi:ligand-binding sensor domain-containing protein
MPRLLYLVLPLALSWPALADDNCKPEASRPQQGRQTWEQHFNQANLAHDGHLTIEEAKAGFPLVAKHFDDIDAEHKGYVTVNDMRAWQVMRKAARQLGKPQEDKLRPRSAVQHTYPDAPSNALSHKPDLTVRQRNSA